MKFERTLAAMLFSLVLTASVFAEHPRLKANREYKFDEAGVCSMDSVGLWCGGGPSDVSISEDRVEGSGSLQVNVQLARNEFVRVENNFADGFYDVGAYLHGMNIKQLDFSDVKAISFSVKTALSADAELTVRIYDRFSGWLEWPTQKVDAKAEWKRVTLIMPKDAEAMVDLTSVGGVSFEFAAADGDLTGTVLLDDMVFSKEPADGLKAVRHEPLPSDYSRAVFARPIARPLANRDVHIIMFANISTALNEGDGQLAIEKLSESVARFRDMPNVEHWYYVGEAGMFMNPEAPETAAKLAKSKEATLETAKWCEKNHVPFYQGPGHVIPICIDKQWMEEILDAAPNYCKGIFMHEFSPEDNAQLPQMVELLDVLKSRGKKMVFSNQTSYWFAQMLPYHKEYRNTIMSPKYSDTFVPMWENLLPAAQGLCMAGCTGYWRTGQAAEWGVSAQSWTYANLSFGLTDQMPANWWLRMFVSGVAFGANYIEIEPDWPFNGLQLSDKFPKGGYLLKLGRQPFQPWYEDSVEMKALKHFQDLLSQQALLAAASPDELVSFPAVTFQAVDGPGAGQWGIFERGVDERINQSYCPTGWDMSCQPSPYAAFRKLYRSMQHFDQTIPETPYGLVSVIPTEKTLEGVETLKTDGVGLLVDGEWVTHEKAAVVIEEAYTEATKGLPFAAEGCLISATKIGENEYQVVLMDPEERFPVGVNTELDVRLKGKWYAYDAVSGESLGKFSKRLNIEIPPAGFRIIRVTKTN